MLEAEGPVTYIAGEGVFSIFHRYSNIRWSLKEYEKFLYGNPNHVKEVIGGMPNIDHLKNQACEWKDGWFTTNVSSGCLLPLRDVNIRCVSVGKQRYAMRGLIDQNTITLACADIDRDGKVSWDVRNFTLTFASNEHKWKHGPLNEVVDFNLKAEPIELLEHIICQGSRTSAKVKLDDGKMGVIHTVAPSSYEIEALRTVWVLKEGNATKMALR